MYQRSRTLLGSAALLAAAVAAAALSASSFVALTLVWAVAMLAAMLWRHSRRDIPDVAYSMALPFLASNGAWVGGYILLNRSDGSSDSAALALLGTGSVLFAVVTLMTSRIRAGGPDSASALDGLAFIAALIAPLWLGVFQPMGGTPAVAVAVISWLLLLGSGSTYILGPGRWNVPAVLFAVGIVVNVSVSVGAMLAAYGGGAALPPASTPLFLGGLVCFTAAFVHPRFGEMFEPGHRPGGLPLMVRVWMLPACVAAPLACLGAAYVTGARPPVELAGGLLAVMAGVVALRSWLLARARVRGWHVPVTISISTLFVGIAGITLAMLGHNATEARERAAALSRAVPLVAALDGEMLRATARREQGRVRATGEARRGLQQLGEVDTMRYPELDTEVAAYVGIAEGTLAVRAEGSVEQAARMMREQVRPAQEQLLASTQRAAAREDRLAHSETGRSRVLSIVALLITLVGVTALLMRFALASRRLEREITETRDALTGLPNRLALELRLGDLNGACGLVLLDLDDFKAINDASGHTTGDEILTAVAARLDASTRGHELLARIDGDAFAVLVEGAESATDAIDVVERMHGALREPIVVDGTLHQISGSVGVAVRGGDEHVSGTDLARDAELAMYEAKRVRGNSVEVFAPEMHAAASERLSLANELRDAIDRGGLSLHYQPIVDLSGGRTMGYEALVRWEHPERGPLRPDQFIPVAERTGLIVDLGGWVLREACRQMSAWRAEWRDHRYVSVNVAGEQLESGVLAEQVRIALDRSGLPPAALLLEVTESSLIANVEVGVEQMAAVRALGVRFALDDFGTGYSSLSYLQRFPIDVLKVDKSFIDHVEQTDGGALVEAIVRMAGSLRMRVVAEGIEAEGQAALLRRMGCELGQGYRFSRPLPADSVPGTPVMLGSAPDLRLTG